MSMIRNKKQGAGYITVTADQADRRIDNFIIAELKKVPKSRIYRMLRRGEIRVNGGRIKPEHRLKAGDKVRIPPVHIPREIRLSKPSTYLVKKVTESLIYEDSNILVLNKPTGIVVHSGSGRTFGIIEILRFIRPDAGDLQLVHRLDRETSGCLVLAKNAPALRQLHLFLREGKLQKNYITLLKGRLVSDSMEVSKPVQKNITSSGESMMKVVNQGRHALTRFVSQWKYKNSTLAQVTLYTGRTHQIRVHAAYIGHPVAGDTKYGDKEFNRKMREQGLKRLFLHASELVIPPLPGMKKDMLINIPLAEDLDTFLHNNILFN